MKKIVIALSALSLALALAQAAPPASQPALSSKPVEKDGLSISVTMAKATFAPDEPLKFTVQFKNTSDKPFLLLDPAYFWDWTIRFEDQRKMGPWQLRALVQASRARSATMLKPGDTLDVQVVLDAKQGNADFEWAGLTRHDVAFAKTLPVDRYRLTIGVNLTSREKSDPPFWGGQIVTNPVEFEITDSATTKTQPTASKPASAPADASKLIADLSSDDGAKRVAASKALFALGKDAIEPLKKAGAVQLTPLGPRSERRMDMVYSLLEGFPPNPANLPRGYHNNGFKLVIEKECTADDVKKMGATHGFTIPQNFNLNHYAFLGKGNNLAEVIKAVLSNEPKVITINVEYFEIMP